MNPYINPYVPLFSFRDDIAFTAAFVLIWLIIAGVYFRGRDRDRQRQTGPYFLYVLQSMAWLCGAIAALFAMGFLLLMGLKTSLWMIWELAWGLAVICTFRVLPVFWLLLLAAMVSSRRKNISAIRFSVICLVLLFLDAALYFLLEVMLRRMVG